MITLRWLGLACFALITCLHFYYAIRDRTWIADALSMLIITIMNYRWPESTTLIWLGIFASVALKVVGVWMRRARKKVNGADSAKFGIHR